MSMVKYSDEFKEQVVREVVDKGRSIASVAASYDLVLQRCRQIGYEYRKEHGNTKEWQAAVGAVEVNRLKKQVRELQQERESLKRAAAFFAKEQQ